jgi:hypothetical protein
MLALSASELAVEDAQPAQLEYSALSHRVQAIRLFNKAMLRPILTFEEGNAMIATCYNLCFQSALLKDAFPDYMVFIRGVILVSSHLATRNLKIIFKDMMADGQLQKMGPHLNLPALISPDIAAEVSKSLDSLLPFCLQQAEKDFHACLLGFVRGLSSSAREGQIFLVNAKTRIVADQKSSISGTDGNLR